MDRRPPQCQCEVDTWPTGPIPAVCASYVKPHKQSGRSFCCRCTHDPECHGVPRDVYRRRRMVIDIVGTRPS